MDPSFVTLPIAFIAGFISFVSPCVLPLVPAYIGYMGGRLTHSVAVSQPSERQRWLSSLLHSLFFIGGFTFVFVSLGLLLYAFVDVVGGDNVNTLRDMIGRIGGVVIIVFGLHFMGLLPTGLARFRRSDRLISSPLVSLLFALLGGALLMWGFSGKVAFWDSALWMTAAWAPELGLFATASFLIWLVIRGAFTDPAIFWRGTLDGLTQALYADTRRIDTAAQDHKGYIGSAAMGVVFAAGWSPCIGPVYGGILTMAAQGSASVSQVTVLLASYSLGLGLPFFITAFALDRAQTLLRRLQRHMHAIELLSGAFLVGIGILVAGGTLQDLSARFGSSDLALAQTKFEQQVVDALTGQTDTAGTEVPPNLVMPTAVPGVIRPSGLQNRAESMPVNVPPNGIPPEIASISDLGDGATASLGTETGDLAPDFDTLTDSGQPIRLTDYRGKVVLVNFWATWCGPCLVEMPDLEAVYNRYKDQGFTVIAVNNQESAAAVRAFRDEQKLSFPLALDESGAIQLLYGVQNSYPSSFLLDRDGVILMQRKGILDPDELQTLLSQVMAA